jgi:hypothetical protein
VGFVVEKAGFEQLSVWVLWVSFVKITALCS